MLVQSYQMYFNTKKSLCLFCVQIHSGDKLVCVIHLTPGFFRRPLNRLGQTDSSISCDNFTLPHSCTLN